MFHVFNIIFSLSIAGNYLKQIYKESGCCNKLNDMCCAIDFNKTLYNANVLKNIYSEHSCCGNSCDINIDCENCTIFDSTCAYTSNVNKFIVSSRKGSFPYYSFVPILGNFHPDTYYSFKVANDDNCQFKFTFKDDTVNYRILHLNDESKIHSFHIPVNYEDDVIYGCGDDVAAYVTITENSNLENVSAKIDWDIVNLNDVATIRLSVNISDSLRKYSGLQFRYETDAVFGSSNLTLLPNVVQVDDSIYMPTYISESSLNIIQHERNDNFILFHLKPRRQQFSQTFLYMISNSSFSYFNIYDEIISDDRFPANAYNIKK